MENDDWQIRAASAGDETALALIGASSFLETYARLVDGDAIVTYCCDHHNAAVYRQLLADGYNAWLARAKPTGAPVGYALLTPPDLAIAEGQEGDVELRRIYALSAFHGSGLGKAMLEQAVLAARQSASRLLLGVYRGNARAVAFYEKNGFKKIGDRQHQVGDRLYDDYILAKAL